MLDVRLFLTIFFCLIHMHKCMSPHGDLDHMGSSYKLIEKIEIENIYFNSNSYNEHEIELINLLKEKKISYQKIEKYLFSYDEISFNIQSYNLKEENDSSMIFNIIDRKTNLKFF